MLRYYIREYERLVIDRYPACSEVYGSRIETSLTIIDLNGVSMKMMNKRVFNFIKLASKTA